MLRRVTGLAALGTERSVLRPNDEMITRKPFSALPRPYVAVSDVPGFTDYRRTDMELRPAPGAPAPRRKLGPFNF